MKKHHILTIIAAILLLSVIIQPVLGEACSFCEFINISKGDPGSPGAPGADGSSPTITVNYTITGLPGTSASVINIGDAINAVFDFTIPAGATGATGSPGIAGYSPVFGVDYFNGINGINGTNGYNTTMVINRTFTGLPGTQANVTNVGNLTAARFDVTIPQGTTGATGAAGATGGTGGQILYFRYADSTDPITYEGLIPVPAGAIEVDENVTVKTGLGQVLLDSYITDIGYPAVTQLPAGLWRFRTFHYVNGASGTTSAVFKVYNRTASGTETLLFTATSDDINDLVVNEYLTSYVQTSAYTVSLTDRLVVKIYGQSTHSANIAFHWVYEGSTHTSHIQATLESAPATSLSFPVVAAETLYKGQAVYISGASGGNPTVSKADNTNTTKSRVVGLMADNTASGAVGQARRAGALTSVDTRTTSTNVNPLGQTWAAGDLLFATTGGGLTNVRPTSGRSVKAGYSLAGSSASDVLLAYPMENPVWSTAASGENIVLREGDSVGVNKISIRNYTNTEVASIDSYGNALFNGNTWVAWTPSITWTGGITPAGVSTRCRWSKIGRVAFFECEVTSADSNACTGLKLTLPVSHPITSAHAIIPYLEDAGTAGITSSVATISAGSDELIFTGFTTAADNEPIGIYASGNYEIP